MDENVAEGHDLRPGHLRVATRQVRRNTRGSFADHAQFLHDGTRQHLGPLKRLEIGAGYEFGDVVGGLNDADL